MWIWGFQPALGFSVCLWGRKCGFEVSSIALGILACIWCFWCAFGVSSMALGSPVWIWGFPAWLWGSQSGFGVCSVVSPRSGTRCRGRNRPSTTSWHGRSGSCTRSSTQPGRHGTTTYVWPPHGPFPGSGWREGAGCARGSAFGVLGQWAMVPSPCRCSGALPALFPTAGSPRGGQKPRKDLKPPFPGQEEEAKAREAGAAAEPRHGQ